MRLTIPNWVLIPLDRIHIETPDLKHPQATNYLFSYPNGRGLLNRDFLLISQIRSVGNERSKTVQYK